MKRKLGINAEIVLVVSVIDYVYFGVNVFS